VQLLSSVKTQALTPFIFCFFGGELSREKVNGKFEQIHKANKVSGKKGSVKSREKNRLYIKL
jgi:hypothetical protein